MFSSLRRSRVAFTLLELIVVIVILGILAALAIPTFALVISRSKLETAETTLAAVSREAQALTGFENERAFTPELVQEVVTDLGGTSAQAGTWAADKNWKISTTAPYAFDGFTILAAITPEKLSLSLYVPEAGCAFATSSTTHVETWSSSNATYYQCTTGVAEGGKTSSDENMKILRAPATPAGFTVNCNAGCRLTWDGTKTVDIFRNKTPIGTSSNGVFVDPQGTNPAAYEAYERTTGTMTPPPAPTASAPYTPTTKATMLSWSTAVPGPYDVYRNGEKIGTTEDDTYIDRSPVAGGTYSIRPINGSPLVPTVGSVPVPAAAAPPVATVTDEGVTLQWGAVPNTPEAPLDGYVVYRQVGGSDAWGEGSRLGTTELDNYQDTLAAQPGTFCYRVASYGPGGTSGMSEIVCVEVKATTAPSAPLNLAAATSNQTAVLTWSAPADDGGAAISSYKGTVTTGSTTVREFEAGGGTLTHTLTGLTNSTSYTISLVAVNPIGAGPSAVTSFTYTPQTRQLTHSSTGQPFIVPAGVTLLTIQARGASGGNGSAGGTSHTGGAGGKGALVTASIPVTPGETLYAHTGGAGSTTSRNVSTPGVNGGGAAGTGGYIIGSAKMAGSGGGATDIRRGTSGANRILVAGGGGGAPTSTGSGGAGGALNALAGSGTSDPTYCTAGGGGSSTTGGTAGTTKDTGLAAASMGSASSGGYGGGKAGNNSSNHYPGGGGGGGYYGGGGGGFSATSSTNNISFGCGGGGGSSYVISAATSTSSTAGFHTGDGTVTFSW